MKTLIRTNEEISISEDISRDLNMILDLEKVLKDVIRNVLKKTYDSEWKNVMKDTVLGKDFDYYQNLYIIEEKMRMQAKSADVFISEKDILDYVYLKDIFNIIIWFWKDFQEIFGEGNNKSNKKVRAVFDQLAQYRNKLAHPKNWYAIYQHYYFLGNYNYIMYKLNLATKKSLLDVEFRIITEKDYRNYYVLKDNDKIMENVKKCMKNLKNSLYYMGAVGFLSEDQEYKELLESVNRDENIEVCRFIDLMTIEELRNSSEYYERTGEKKYAFSNLELLEYIIWIGSQSKSFAQQNYFNYKLIPFSGMPIWRYGINIMIFDEDCMMFIFRVADGKNNAYFVEDSKVVKVFRDYVFYMRDKLKRYPATQEEVLEKIFRVPPSFGKDIIDEVMHDKIIDDELSPVYINSLIHDLSQGKMESIGKLKGYIND